ncbi:hypothetical protein A8924_4070 [Saccharopolyspora erythraea NRRL 2338]|uniref:Uncharacterized protein n=2 Tax=Saccharopolyspora erythraea TaxID=1836 RepID=A4FFX9_SACEN|nr:DUF6204 family protein [Saccharopolyspora erythraea]EQD84034.1 hypothetical protein N599_22150 [Saccharopolyspora erythraea D]PFG96660.1 hypothetical protein A8924_4070 [Saccharopolyspora erythraea NRRL 2338]QRK93140.1 hypothetical protein JQX30_18775 [Saccharopolyspora erythraea]CAM02954.1 conserved hypothetical protein [Saccharopolyspora erythraea NRRL 2338]
MAEQVHRVILRGKFGGLDRHARAALLAEADDHDVLDARFTGRGSLTYDRRLAGFTFRCELSVPEDIGRAELRKRAETKLAALLAAFGCGHRDLELSSTNMARIKIRRR